ncbi:MAG TPA: methyltransferase [Gaiellaceae bacterium]|nr:methyltransferase [Gaiellaceae bacterium]
MTSVLPPSSDRPDELAALRAVLAAAGYTGPAIQARLGTDRDVLSRPADFAPHLRRLEGDESALASLIRIFVLLASESVEAADRVFAPLGADGLERLGLVSRQDERLVAAVRLIPHDEFAVASDLSESEAGAEHVPGVQRPSNTLANLTIRRPVARALDMGTGNGIQALLAARHAEHVVATDVNERALAFARFNLALNSAENVELRLGSFLEPVAGERFDLVVANPPYVISPESSFVFRDSGLGRDRVSEELVRALPALLEEGGLATVMVSWVQEGDDLTARPGAWLDGSGCDAWILHTGTDDALSAAAGWNRAAPTPEERAEKIDRWLEYYRSEGIEAISYGAIVLRKRSDAANWLRSTELPRGRFAQAGPALERMLAAQDFLETVATDELLLDHRFRIADDVTLEQRLAQERGLWALRQAELRLEGGLGFTAGLDPSAARVVSGLDPSRTLRAALEEAADALEVDRNEFLPAGAALLRRMVTLGFAVPAD